MFSFAAAYLMVLLALILYVARLGLGQRRLGAELSSLREQLQSASDRDRPSSRAA